MPIRAEAIVNPREVEYDSNRVATLSQYALLFDEMTVGNRTTSDTSTTMTEEEVVLILTATSDVTVTLPDPADVSGRIVIVKRTSTEIVLTVQAGGSANVEGAATHVILGGGAAGVIYHSDGTAWWAIGTTGAAGGFRHTTVNVSSTPYTITAADTFVIVSIATATINIPSGSLYDDQEVTVKAVAASPNVSVTPTGSATIDGLATVWPLSTRYQSITIVSEAGATDWWIK